MYFKSYMLMHLNKTLDDLIYVNLTYFKVNVTGGHLRKWN